MAYLIQSTNAPLTEARQDSSHTSHSIGAGLMNSVISFLHPTRHASSAVPAHTPATMAASPGSTTTTATSHSARTPITASSSSLSSLPAGSHARAGPPTDVTSTTTASPLASGAPVDPSLLSTQIEDAQLFRFGIDYEELMAIMNAPCHAHEEKLPPSASPTTSSAFSSAFAAGSGAAGTGGILCPSALHFTRISDDPKTGISLCSSPVPNCPVHLMRATAIMPCSPAEFLQYMDSRVRGLWDTYSEKGYIVRELPVPEAVEAQLARAKLQPQTDSLQVTATRTATDPTHASANTGTSSSSSSSSSASSSPPPFAYLPGQRRVALHYLAVRSPVPFVQSRDFELVVTEEVREDGTAYMKAFSAPFGYCVPVDVDQNRYVRAVCLSGVVARPLTGGPARVPPALRHLVDSTQLRAFMNDTRSSTQNSSGTATATRTSSAPREFCELSYYGLVHPMGLIPPVLVNMVISAQLSTLRNLQQFIVRNPLSTLLPANGGAAKAAVSSSSSSSSHTTDGESTVGEDVKARKTTRPVSKKPSSWRERLLSKL